MSREPAFRTRLCPHCANSIAEDATQCPYCKADFSSEEMPAWLKRDELASALIFDRREDKKFSIDSKYIKYIWPAAMVLVALAAFFAGVYKERHQVSSDAVTQSKQLDVKDQVIRSQEAQLTETRQQLSQTSTQLAEVKAKLEQSEKELVATQQRLQVAGNELSRASANQAALARRVGSRTPDASAASSAGRVASRFPDPSPVPRSPAQPTERIASRPPDSVPPPPHSGPAPSAPVPSAGARSINPGSYETTRPTSVYEDPSPSSRVLSQINRGMRINVVGGSGEWLEVRSKYGNPPGYVRADDARAVRAVN